MKICSLCGATYSEHVDFCFNDGTPLTSVDTPAPTPSSDPPLLRGVDVPSVEPPSIESEPDSISGLDLPEPVSLSAPGRSFTDAADVPEPTFDPLDVPDPFNAADPPVIESARPAPAPLPPLPRRIVDDEPDSDLDPLPSLGEDDPPIVEHVLHDLDDDDDDATRPLWGPGVAPPTIREDDDDDDEPLPEIEDDPLPPIEDVVSRVAPSLGSDPILDVTRPPADSTPISDPPSADPASDPVAAVAPAVKPPSAPKPAAEPISAPKTPAEPAAEPEEDSASASDPAAALAPGVAFERSTPLEYADSPPDKKSPVPALVGIGLAFLLIVGVGWVMISGDGGDEIEPPEITPAGPIDAIDVPAGPPNPPPVEPPPPEPTADPAVGPDGQPLDAAGDPTNPDEQPPDDAGDPGVDPGPGPQDPGGQASADPGPGDRGKSSDPRDPWAGGNEQPEDPPVADAADPWSAPEAASAGRIVISSTPSGAQVSIGGSFKGVTPLTLSDMPYGSYAISVSKDGYQSQSNTLNLQAPSASVPFELVSQRTDVLVQFYAPTQGAQIHKGSELVCVTPCPVTSLAEGNYVFRVTLPNTTRYNVSKEIRAGGSQPLRVPLNPE